MARRKKAKKTSHRRRRVSGVALSAKSPLVQFGSIAAGYFLGDKINSALSSVTGTLDPKIVAAGEALAGYLIKSKVKGTTGAVLGGVLMGAGVKKGLQEFGVISGLPTVGSYRDLRTINGLPAPVRRVAGIVPGQSPSMSVIGSVGNYDEGSAYMDN